ncbi:MAG TPA: ABC transporter permease subunit, partial [Methylomirabilota bacterium]|nr:ABC transporter permease subunit [Methylomirabilota bacterium]
MKPIIYWGVRDRRWTIFGWSLGISLYAALIVLVYSSIGDQAQALSQVTDNLPATAKALFSDTNDLLSPIGYLSSKLYYLMMPMLFTILAIILSSQLFSREEQNGTMELLLARPVSRSKLLAAKLISGLI